MMRPPSARSFAGGGKQCKSRVSDMKQHPPQHTRASTSKKQSKNKSQASTLCVLLSVDFLLRFHFGLGPRPPLNPLSPRPATPPVVSPSCCCRCDSLGGWWGGGGRCTHKRQTKPKPPTQKTRARGGVSKSLPFHAPTDFQFHPPTAHRPLPHCCCIVRFRLLIRGSWWVIRSLSLLLSL